MHLCIFHGHQTICHSLWTHQTMGFEWQMQSSASFAKKKMSFALKDDRKCKIKHLQSHCRHLTIIINASTHTGNRHNLSFVPAVAVVFVADFIFCLRDSVCAVRQQRKNSSLNAQDAQDFSIAVGSFFLQLFGSLSPEPIFLKCGVRNFFACDELSGAINEQKGSSWCKRDGGNGQMQ